MKNQICGRTGGKRRVQNKALAQEAVKTSGDHDLL
jgi:hypothetical protein